MTDKFMSTDPQNKSFVENTEEIDIDSIEWWDHNNNICPQCGQDHSYKITAGTTMLDIISLSDKDISREI
jgi:hypothetical protein